MHNNTGDVSVQSSVIERLPSYADTGERFVPDHNVWVVVDHNDGFPPSVCQRPVWYHHGRWVPMEDESFLSHWDGKFYSSEQAARQGDHR